ncbi:MAG: DNA topoisomerase, partial [Planctomycetota bacterium]|nr:DNA topoisomerase [Planctomycetota bacterium]
QVSPLLWKKVARGLSAGRVQSVAVRLIVEREREIRAFIPDEDWKISAAFSPEIAKASGLAEQFAKFLAKKDEKGNAPTLKARNAWLSEHDSFAGELIQIGGEKFEIGQTGSGDATPKDLTDRVREVAELAGMIDLKADVREDEKGKGPARFRRTITGRVATDTPYRIDSIETKRTSTRPRPPFITSTLQQDGANRLGFGAQRTMRAAQQLYEGVDVPGEGSIGLITYMRTDSTHLTGDAIEMARNHILKTYGDRYLPEKPNFFSSSNKAAQEAHEAIRPTSMAHPPDKVKGSLKPDQYKVYKLIWDRFVSCQMPPAEFDATTVLIKGGTDRSRELTFKATGRRLVFDGFYRATGLPTASEDQMLPGIEEQQKLAPLWVEPQQTFSNPPPRYTEASLIKTLEREGIGRPSTYASIISVIQDRKYVEQLDRRFFATDLGEVVTDKLIEAFPEIMEVGYTRDLEEELDQIEEENRDWVRVLHDFYGPFQRKLERAHEEMTHAKAEVHPAPKEYRCEKCGSDLVYRFGKNWRFLSCSQYPKCDYACPCDREGKPAPEEPANVQCHLCERPMIKRNGRFGPFFGCSGYPECQGILKMDKKGRPLAPQPPPLETDLPCPKCGSALHLRNGARGPWLSCSAFPKCRGRGKWAELPEEQKAHWTAALEAHEKKHPIPVITDLEGNPLTDAKGKPLEQPERDADGEDFDASVAA